MDKKKKMPVWLIVVIVIIILFIIATISGGSDSSNNDDDNTNKNTVVVTDFSNMTRAEIDIWCDENKVKCDIKAEYSDSVEKDKFISQSVEKDRTIYEDDIITIKFSLGKEPTTEQKNALKKAETYSETLHMSKKGIYNQLTSEIEGFTEEDAQYAIDNLDVDWKQNALEKAKSYQQTLSMSKNAIYNQLTSEIEGFTEEEAQYAIDNLED